MAQTPDGAIKSAAKLAGVPVSEYREKLAADLKRCGECREWKPVALFNRDRTRRGGRHARCQGCTRVKVRVSTKGRASVFKGRSHTDGAKAAMSLVAKGRPSKLRGRILSTEQRAVISRAVRAVAQRGEACHSYKDGKLAERRGERFGQPYKRWRFDVFSRDGFACQRCGDARGGNLHAHHIKSFADHPELRLEVSNGLTLCRPCHKLEHAGH